LLLLLSKLHKCPAIYPGVFNIHYCFLIFTGKLLLLLLLHVYIHTLRKINITANIGMASNGVLGHVPPPSPRACACTPIWHFLYLHISPVDSITLAVNISHTFSCWSHRVTVI